jgi:tRNA pseudouridine(38-40) synthase
MRYICKVSYDGSDFAGWQYQTAKRTIQGSLNAALSSIFFSEVKVVGASRTDRGVHAKGQIVHFDAAYRDDFTGMEICEKLNRMLPADIKLHGIGMAPKGMLPIQLRKALPWHAIENSVSKHYSYRFSTSRFVNPFDYRYCANCFDKDHQYGLNTELFQKALDCITGTHDFKAFGNRLEQRAKLSEEYSGEKFSSVRTISRAELSIEENSYLPLPYKSLQSAPAAAASVSPVSTCTTSLDLLTYRVDIELDGALYKMIRNLIAACLAVSRGTLSLETLRYLLHEAPARDSTGLVTAPACGLCLESVKYQEILPFDEPPLTAA